MFTLDQRLQDDSHIIGRFSLSLLLLSKDANYPWLILVPEREDVFELFHLSRDDRAQLMRESCHLADVMTSILDADKINVAALGNVVPQLHLHHIARYRNDPAWPAPIWGKVPAKAYDSEQLQALVAKLTNALSGEGFEAIALGSVYTPTGISSPKIDC
ncbi:MAG TPA: HIT domain-containing protein [Cellvibrionaceae bacterium]